MATLNHYILLIALLLLSASGIKAQKDPNLKPVLSRELFHDFVDKEQELALHSDGVKDLMFTVSSNQEVNYLVTYALIKRIDELQFQIEKDSIMGSQEKIRYIRGLERLLKDLNANWKSKVFSVTSLPSMLGAFIDCMELDRVGKSIENYIRELHYDVARPVVHCTAFDQNPGIKISKDDLVRKYCGLYPEQTFYTLRQYPDVPFADSLIISAGHRFPLILYDYAAATNKLGSLIRKIEDPLVKTVSRMATSGGSGQLYFPFLDNIINGKLTLQEVDVIRRDSIQYYKLLVKTHLDYVKRAINKDTARGYADLEDMLKRKSQQVFVNVINGLHDLDDAARFRVIQPLNAEELYYLAVFSDGIIYTSSYVRGVYPLMMSRVGNRGDSVLKKVMFDHYRKFIKMAAGYNTLSHFLASFSNPSDAEDLMRAFVTGLEKKSIEDGVDVADSYASIAETMKPLADQMLLNIKLNQSRNVSNNDKRGIVIYNLLYNLFLSADSTSNIDLTKELGIPPVYSVSNHALKNDSGRVIIQVFFYGDRDGQNIFNGFQRMFNSSNWKIVPDKLWISIHSLNGQPVSIYANRPLPEETGEDEMAQKALDSFLIKNKLFPTVVIHRGHSYYAPYTIEQIMPSAKIVFMGSCGGYHLIHDILKNAPDAHIIASKQIGKTAINRPFFDLLIEKMRTGSNIEWTSFWKEFKQKVYVPGFEDYIPPHKNLGAIFIKAYKQAMGSDASP